MKIFAKDGTRLRDKMYLEWVKKQPCYLQSPDCFGDVVPAHGRPWGRGIKGPDSEAIPLCFKHHNEEHAGRVEWFNIRKHIASNFYAKYLEVKND